MRPGAILLVLALATPALAQDAPATTPEETAAAIAAVESANLSETAYRNLWCGGLFASRHATETQAALTGAAQQSAVSRDALYRKAAVELLAAEVPEPEFTALAENVYMVVQSQTAAAAAEARDFTDEACAEAAE